MLVVQWVSSLEMDSVTQAQILEEAVCISLGTNTLVKGKNLTILLPAIVK